LSYANNVVTFPKRNINPSEPSLEDIQHNIDMMKHYHIQETILTIAPLIFNQMDVAGFGLAEEEDEDIRDGAFIIEALRSMMCKYYGIYHPFQVIVENVFEEEQSDEGAFKIVEKLEIELKNPSETE
jgi:hypothetical protein